MSESFTRTALEKALTLPLQLQIAAIGLSFLLTYGIAAYLTRQRPYSGFPVIDLKQEEGLGPLASWFRRGEAVLAKGRKTTSGCFQVITGTGPRVSLTN